MAKVAQGWVLSWQAPQRTPDAGELAQLDQSMQSSGSLLPALSQIDETAPGALASSVSQATTTTTSNNNNLQRSVSASQQMAQQQQQQLQPAVAVVAYSVDLKEKNSPRWHTLATAREQSLLLKDLRPGSEYSFRVVAHSASGLKGTPSAEFKYHILDNRRKPGSTQVVSAGVVSGVLFFIACIVIAVCGVNMCNKRRKKRAEKAAYVMMACPVLESHHDLAALNSNSLLKK